MRGSSKRGKQNNDVIINERVRACRSATRVHGRSVRNFSVRQWSSDTFVSGGI